MPVSIMQGQFMASILLCITRLTHLKCAVRFKLGKTPLHRGEETKNTAVMSVSQPINHFPLGSSSNCFIYNSFWGSVKKGLSTYGERAARIPFTFVTIRIRKITEPFHVWEQPFCEFHWQLRWAVNHKDRLLHECWYFTQVNMFSSSKLKWEAADKSG